ncbi:hypothetical protein T11_12698 [Trichinella zimbabwensis]|uniref:Uncharacterized protein n=1 Tax=Trichinella zimbabwensis TaxID=268475 RepID=A0A0V1HC83_9BILA|nr:hypothetical protein T11_12698 [Trichinella zimbabwensis]
MLVTFCSQYRYRSENAYHQHGLQKVIFTVLSHEDLRSRGFGVSCSMPAQTRSLRGKFGGIATLVKSYAPPSTKKRSLLEDNIRAWLNQNKPELLEFYYIFCHHNYHRRMEPNCNGMKSVMDFFLKSELNGETGKYASTDLSNESPQQPVHQKFSVTSLLILTGHFAQFGTRILKGLNILLKLMHHFLPLAQSFRTVVGNK